MEYDRIYSIRKGEYFADALKRAGKEFIPTHCIINKLLPGLGATHCELTAPRKSIIIEPNVPVIESKAKKHKNALETLQEVIEAKRGTVCIFCNSIDSIDSFYRLIPELSNACTFCSEDGQYKLWKGNRRKKSMMITELERYNFFTSRFYSAVDILSKNPPHVILISDLFGAAQSVIDPATEAIQIIGRFRGGVNSVTHIASIRPDLECMTSTEIDHWLEGASTVFNGWKTQLTRTSNIGERTLLQEAIGENSYLPYLDENGKPDPFLIANYYEKEQVKHLYTSTELLCNAYEQTNYFEFSHEERLMPVSDNERLAIQHRLAKKRRAELIVWKLEEMEKISKSNDKKTQKRYQRMIGNLITSTADQYLYDCFCRFGTEFIREADYNENKLRTALNVSSEHTIKKSGQMRTYIQRTFPVGSEFSVQEAKSMLKQVYKKMGLNTGRGVTTKELEQYAEVENGRNRDARMIKILKHK